MKRLLIVTAAIELGAGLALLCCPSVAVTLLLGSPLDAAAALVLGPLAGVALCALGVANWLACYEADSCAARGVVTGMVVYNLGAVVILGAAGLRLRPVGVALWPAVVLHAGMSAWCVTRLLRRPGPVGRETEMSPGGTQPSKPREPNQISR